MMLYVLIPTVIILTQRGTFAYYYEYVTIGSTSISLTGTEMAQPDVSEIIFKVKGCKDAILFLQSHDKRHSYKIGIENGSGSFSKITKFSTDVETPNKLVQVNTSTFDLVPCGNFNELWIHWNNGLIEVGSGSDVLNKTFMSVTDADAALGLQLSSIQSYGTNNVSWIFGDDTETTSFSTVAGHATTSQYSTSDHLTSGLPSSNHLSSGLPSSSHLTSGLPSSDHLTSELPNSDHLTSGIQTTVIVSNANPTTINYGIATTQHDVTVPQLCPCPCVKNITTEELKKKLQTIRTKLLLNKTALSATIRRKSSAPDPRTSSKFLGYLGVFVVTIVILSIVLADVTRVSKAVTKLKKN